MTQAFSAPGKALIVGGYLVLFPEYTAMSIALSSRMHAVVESSSEFVVRSPQFESIWRYDPDSLLPTHEPHKNPFITAVVKTIHAYFGSLKGADITLWSDSGFHSQPETAVPGSYTFHNKHITEVPKTGLGSSAAFCVALTAAVYAAQLEKKLVLDLETKHRIHNLAQIAHCIAQGKVGSGFDVATAVFGTIKYSRFDPALIPQELDSSIRSVVDSRWKMTAEPFAMPDQVCIIMGDITSGSETPSMVRKVLEWRNTNPESASKIWKALNSANIQLMHQLQTAANPTDLAATIADIRAQLQLMTKNSTVPIEPPQQTALLDAVSQVDGVIGGVVPGAGGNDAICLLVRRNQKDSVLKDLGKFPNVNWLDLSEDPHGGLIEQDFGNYPS